MIDLSGAPTDGHRVAGLDDAVVLLANVSRTFGADPPVHALRDVDLAIWPGEWVSIVGPSGSGKSTLLNMVGALERPSSGRISIDGQLLAEMGDDDLTRVRRDKVGFIFQFFNLLPTLTCFENVAIPLHLRGWPKKKIDERVKELLTMVGLAARVDHLPEELSGVERQRCAIARAPCASLLTASKTKSLRSRLWQWRTANISAAA